MAVSPSYREFVLEQLGRVTPISGRSMFGGVGIYAQGLFFALIAEKRLYFKVDDVTRSDFEQRGMQPFRPFGEDSAMGYFEVPAEVVEDSDLLVQARALKRDRLPNDLPSVFRVVPVHTMGAGNSE